MRTDPLNSSTGPSAMDRFRHLLGSTPPEASSLPDLLETLEASESLEMALDALRRRHPDSRVAPGWSRLRRLLEERVQAHLDLRRAQWHLDPRRRRWRLLVAIHPPATTLGPSALQNRLGDLLLAAGLPLAMTLTNRPRPSLTLGPILPLGVESDGEWVDLDLRESPACPPERIGEQFGEHEGIRILKAAAIPLQASPLLELARAARWRWHCPEAGLPEAMRTLETFRLADTWEVEKSGKASGHKVIKRVEVRNQVLNLTWAGSELRFETRLRDGAGMSPQKLLGGILGWPAEAFSRLRREAVLLEEDPRLADRDRYETRLHNMFEDAVLLESGPDRSDEALEGDDDIIRL